VKDPRFPLEIRRAVDFLEQRAFRFKRDDSRWEAADWRRTHLDRLVKGAQRFGRAAALREEVVRLHTCPENQRPEASILDADLF